MRVSVVSLDLLAEFRAAPWCGVAPFEVLFTDLSIGTQPVTSWHWDFGDGGTSIERSPHHMFLTPGSYDITLIASNGLATDTARKAAYIRGVDTLVADFVGFPTGGRVPLTVIFEPTPGGTANGFYWEFGDGATNTLRNPIHTYTMPGTHNVKLRVSLDADECHLMDSIVKARYVFASTLKARFSGQPFSGLTPLVVRFTDQSAGAPTSWCWDFGDGQTSTERNPVHQYNSVDTFDVFLRVADALGVDSILMLGYILTDTVLNADLTSDLWASLFQPGFDFTLWASWTNKANLPAEDCTLRVLLPPQAAFKSVDAVHGYFQTGSYSGYSLAGDTIVIPLGHIDPTLPHGGHIPIIGNLPPSVPCRTIVESRAWLSTGTADYDTSNNHRELTTTVVCSWDPNDKSASPEGEGANKTISPGERLTYRIDFENKREATADAIYVLVFDTLDPDLDGSTLAEGPASHPDKCKLSFDPYTGVITYFCDSIMLPPNVIPPEGDGYFTFSIAPRAGLPNGTQISNRAHIRFDYNEFLAAPDSGPVVRTVSSCDCPCHGDPQCDGVPNVQDVVQTVNVAFRGYAPVFDPQCPKERTDVNCDGFSTVQDVVKVVNVAFRGANPATEFCDPCAP